MCPSHPLRPCYTAACHTCFVRTWLDASQRHIKTQHTHFLRMASADRLIAPLTELWVDRKLICCKCRPEKSEYCQSCRKRARARAAKAMMMWESRHAFCFGVPTAELRRPGPVLVPTNQPGSVIQRWIGVVQAGSPPRWSGVALDCSA